MTRQYGLPKTHRRLVFQASALRAASPLWPGGRDVSQQSPAGGWRALEAVA